MTRLRQLANCLAATAPVVFVTERQARSVADHMLAPTLDRMEADLAVLRSRIDAALNTTAHAAKGGI